jgi:hypothetical protein
LFDVAHQAQSTAFNYGCVCVCVDEAVKSIGSDKGAVEGSAEIRIKAIPKTVTVMAVFKILSICANGRGSRGRDDMRCHHYWVGALCAK